MEFNFAKLDGLIPAVVQDYSTDEVLMLGFMNAEALQATLTTGDVTFYSRTRRKLWTKGGRSGHRLRLRELRMDCDADAVLARVDALGPGVCHEGYRSCFFRQLARDGTARVVAERVFDPTQVYAEEKKP